MKPRFHLGFPSPTISDLPTAEWSGLARTCEDLGFDCLWHSNERFYREMFVRMAVSTLATERIGIGGAIAEPFAVHPAVTAQALATVHELSEGRATLALGAGGSGFPMMGIERRRPARALREAHEIIGRMVTGDTVTVAGEIVQARSARLHFEPPQPAPIIWLATRGDLTLRLAGEVADGVIVATYSRPADVLEAVELVAAGASRAGRELSDVRILARVDTCVHADAETAFDGSRLMVAKLLWSSFPDRGFVERANLEVPTALEEVIATRDYDQLDEAAALVPDDFVDAFCWAGTPTMVAERVVSVARATGIREFGFWVLRAGEDSLLDAVTTLANEVVPEVRQMLAEDRDSTG